MKNIFLSILGIILLISGCTSKEQDTEINAFWKEKVSSFFAQRLGKRPSKNSPALPQGTELDAPGKPLSLQEHPAQEQAQPEQQPANLEAQEPSQNPPQTQEDASAQPAAKQPSVNDLPKNISIKAVLFTHQDSPLTKQLKEDHWDQLFLQRYRGRVFLVEYDMKDPASKAPLQEMMRKHKLSTITVPVLFVGNQSFQGYPFSNTDLAVKQALEAAAHAQQRSAQKRKNQSNQFMEIIMEDTQKPQRVNTKASARDNRAIQLALDKVEQNNQAILVDLGSIFGEEAKVQAYAVISRTERLLRKKASSSPDLKTYLATQNSLLELQEKELNKIMRQNVSRLRSTRG